METTMIKIGKSKGVKLSQPILDKYDIQDKVEIELKKDYIVIKPVKNIRQGWDKAFKQMHENNDDSLIIPDVFPEEEFEKW
ncbi:MAG: MazF family transcriptional regulator [Ignavibacteria bacterium]|nr:MazF family transcriptional regulator [Ignavibacteria bacterium]